MVLASVICTIPFQLNYFTKEFGAPFLIKKKYKKQRHDLFEKQRWNWDKLHTGPPCLRRESAVGLELASGEVASCVYSVRTTFLNKLWKIIAK